MKYFVQYRYFRPQNYEISQHWGDSSYNIYSWQLCSNPVVCDISASTCKLHHSFRHSKWTAVPWMLYFYYFYNNIVKLCCIRLLSDVRFNRNKVHTCCLYLSLLQFNYSSIWFGSIYSTGKLCRLQNRMVFKPRPIFGRRQGQRVVWNAAQLLEDMRACIHDCCLGYRVVFDSSCQHPKFTALVSANKVSSLYRR